MNSGEECERNRKGKGEKREKCRVIKTADTVAHVKAGDNEGAIAGEANAAGSTISSAY